jgi:uncharacterized protein YbjT (DUF2867 family)
MTIAVTGATGFVGQAFCDAALGAGLELRALVRKPQEPRAGIAWTAGDLSDRAALARLVEGAEAVVHIAGVVNASDHAGFREGNVTGTLAVVEAAVAAGVPRLVFVSSLSAREPGLSAYGASKAQAEKVVRASGIDWTIVRPPAIYGPRDREMFELFRAAKWGVVPMPGEGRASLIHVEDMAGLLVSLLPGGEDVSHRSFEPDDGKPGGWEHHELALAIGWAVGRRPKVIRLSRRTMDWASRADGWLRGSGAKLTADRVGYMSHPDWAVSEGRQPPRHRWHPRIETRGGLKSTAQWYREAGWL